MDVLLRVYARWKGRRRHAQVIVFDGAGEVETARAFLKGGLTGVGMSLLLFAVMAPSGADPELLREAERRAALLREAEERSEHATALVHACLRTAEGMEETLLSYRRMLRSPSAAAY